MWYSICDVNLPLAQKICQKDLFGWPLQKDSSKDFCGWLSDVKTKNKTEWNVNFKDKINSIRVEIKRDVALTAQKYNADELGLEDSQDDAEESENAETSFDYWLLYTNNELFYGSRIALIESNIESVSNSA